MTFLFKNLNFIKSKVKTAKSRLARACWMMKSKPQNIEDGIKRLQKSKGLDLYAWMNLADFAIQDRKFNQHTLQALESHGRLCEDSVFLHYSSEILSNADDQLTKAAEDITQENYFKITENVILDLIKYKSIYQCRDSHTLGGYYAAAEEGMDWQWEQLIYPIIKDFDFTKVLELAPGHGRNTNKLRKLSKDIFLVDVNNTCIDACRVRFGDEMEGCKFHYAVNDGSLLPMISSKSVTAIYSFDSMVHFDKNIVREYMREFKRILAPGGKGFLHHSNYGSIAPNSDWAKNPGNRSDMSAELFKAYAEEVGLLVVSQKLHGHTEGRSIEGLDCVSVIQQSS